MQNYTQQNFLSTEFVLKHNYTLNRNTVSADLYRTLYDANNYEFCNEGRPFSTSVSTTNNPIHKWLRENTWTEFRRYDCPHSIEFVDLDPIPELFPNYEMMYAGRVFDPDASKAFRGINDPVMLKVLYRCKFRAGTPQAFLLETPIIGWVMYYDFGEWLWIVEIQANNKLQGGVLSTPTGGRHFYRNLLATFVQMTSRKNYILLSAEAQDTLHRQVRPNGLPPPTSPYRKDVMLWCGFTKKRLIDLSFDLQQYSAIANITPDMTAWHLGEGGHEDIN